MVANMIISFASFRIYSAVGCAVDNIGLSIRWVGIMRDSPDLFRTRFRSKVPIRGRRKRGSHCWPVCRSALPPTKDYHREKDKKWEEDSRTSKSKSAQRGKLMGEI
jgi:hypothetical protein